MTTPAAVSGQRPQMQQQLTGVPPVVHHRRERPPGILRLDISEPKPRRSSVEFRTPTETNVSPSPQTPVDYLSVTFAPARKSMSAETPTKVNPISPTSTLLNTRMSTITDRLPPPEPGEGSEDEDYSASVNAVMMRRASTRKSRRKSMRRRTSSPFSPDVESLYSAKRRRSSVYTTSSGETVISVNETAGSEEVYELLKLHKEVLSAVRTQPWPMRRKLRLVQLAQTYVKQHEGALQQRLAASRSTSDILKRYRLLLNKKWQYIKREIANFSKYVTPWELRIKQIESQFGSVVASYFTFLRWLLWVNLVMAVILTSFITIPEILTAKTDEAGDRKSILPDEEEKKANLATLVNFEGILKHSPLFYGYYSNTNKRYRLPLAYFITGLLVYAYSFMAILRRMAANSRLSKLSEKDDEYIFTWKLFTGWDYMIGNPETAQNRISSLVLGFKEALLEEAEKKRQDRNWKVIMCRIFVNFSVLVLLGISAFAVVWVVRRSSENGHGNVSWWRKNEINLVLNLISLIFPFLFEILGLLEYYHPRKQLRIQLFRIMLLNLLNLYSLIIALFDKIGDMTEKLQELSKTSELTNITAPSVKLKKLSQCRAGQSTTIISPTNLYPQTDNVTKSVTLSVQCNETFINCTKLTETVTKAVMTILLTNYLTTPATNFTENFNYTTEFSVLNSTFNTTLSYSELAITNSLWDYNTTSLNENITSFELNNTDIYSNFTITSINNFTLEPTNGSDYDSISNDFDSGNNNFLNDNSPQALIDVVNDLSVIANITVATANESELSNIQKLIEKSITNEVANNYTNGKGLSITSTSSDQCVITKCPADDVLVSNANLIQCNNFVVDTSISIKDINRLLNFRKEIRPLCWETSFGQELVKLTVTDLVFTIVTTLIVDFFRALFVRYMNNCWCWDLEKKFPKYGDFKIAENILHLVNNQGMVWMGMFFSPGLVLINLIKLVIMMYLRSWTVLTCNVPHEIVFRASRSNNFYFALLLTMLFLCVLPVGYAIVWVKPSWHCGPFSGHKTISEMFTKYLHEILPEKLHQALDYIASPGIIIPLLILLVLIIYYLMSLTNALREANHDLKAQLRKERTEERRKMFQIADKRYKSSSPLETTPYGKWKKLFSAMAVTKSPTQDTCMPITQTDNTILETPEREEKKKKEIMAKIMKNAFGMPLPQVEGDATNTEVRDSLPEDVKEINKSINVTEEIKAKVVKSEKPQKIHKSKKTGSKEGDTSAWTDNIPVIKISKTESTENILNSDQNSEQKDLKHGNSESDQKSDTKNPDEETQQKAIIEGKQRNILSRLFKSTSKCHQKEPTTKTEDQLKKDTKEKTEDTSKLSSTESGKNSPKHSTVAKEDLSPTKIKGKIEISYVKHGDELLQKGSEMSIESENVKNLDGSDEKKTL